MHLVTSGMAEAGGQGGVRPPPQILDRPEVAAGKRRRAALLKAHLDFQTFHHPWTYLDVIRHLYQEEIITNR